MRPPRGGGFRGGRDSGRCGGFRGGRDGGRGRGGRGGFRDEGPPTEVIGLLPRSCWNWDTLSNSVLSVEEKSFLAFRFWFWETRRKNSEFRKRENKFAYCSNSLALEGIEIPQPTGGVKHVFFTDCLTFSEVSTFLHACEGDAVTKLTNEKIPMFNAPIYLQHMTQIGKVDEIFGPINDALFSIKMMEGIVPTSYSSGDKFYIDPRKLLPLARFLPQPKGQPQASRGGGRGGGRGFRGGSGFRGRGGPRGGRGVPPRGGGFRARGRS